MKSVKNPALIDKSKQTGYDNSEDGGKEYIMPWRIIPLES